MGDLQDYPNGCFMMDDRRFEVPLWPPFTASNPDPSSIVGDNWDVAEETIKEMLCCIHPSLDSEEKRKDVIEYVQKLIRTSLGCEVFPYGSVPLKTYLPDGDIDLTALSTPTADGNLAHDVLALLQAEEQKENTEYEVKDTQFIDAEVKLVKCLVQDIVIDISFNQLGGLCSLCFLEQIDHIVGKDHLFKRSIILIKAWCYYESRILGAHHGLISTYALETLVLYIFHLFHSSLNGPVAVLYRFLDYFSKFDWDNCCISLKGPVLKASLPDLVVQMPPNLEGNFLLTEEFLRNCLDMFSVPSKGPEADVRFFPLKHINIIDPLKENNNLGRSVHRGNYYRIRSALKFGARKLGRILLLPADSIADEMKRFFSNTIERHGSNYANLSCFQSSTLSEETTQGNSWTSDLENFLPGMGYNGGGETYLLGLMSEKTCSVDGSGSGVSGSHLAAGEAAVMNDSPHCSSSSSVGGDLTHALSRLNFYATPYHYSGSCTENGKWHNGVAYKEKPANLVDEKVCRNVWMEHSDKYYLALDSGLDSSCISSEHDGGSCYSGCSTISSPHAASTLSEGLSLDLRESDIIAGSPETPEPLPELTGDYDNHIRSLLYGQCCNGYASSATAALPIHPTFPCQPQNETMDHLVPSFSGLNGAGKHNPQEADLYFPNLNGCSMERSSSNEAPTAADRQQRSSSENPVLYNNKGKHCSQSQVLSNGHFQLSGGVNHPAGGTVSNSHLNGFSVPLQTTLEFGSLGRVLSEECMQPGYCGQSSSLKIKNSSIGS